MMILMELVWHREVDGAHGGRMMGGIVRQGLGLGEGRISRPHAPRSSHVVLSGSAVSPEMQI